MPQMTLGEGGSSPGNLSQGSKGEAVRKLQEELKAAGYDPGPIDGKFGELTAAALQGFQQSKGLEADAIAGPLSRTALAQTPALTTPTYTGATPQEEQRLRTAVAAQPTSAVTTPLSGAPAMTTGVSAATRAGTSPFTRPAGVETFAEQEVRLRSPETRAAVAPPAPVTPEVRAGVSPFTRPPGVESFAEQEARLRSAETQAAVATPTWMPPATITPPTTIGGGQPAGGAAAPTTTIPTGGAPAAAPTTPQYAPYVGPAAPAPSNIAGLFNLPTGTQYAQPSVTTPRITTPTFTAPGATPQPPAQQVTPERQALLAQLNRLQENNAPQATYSPFTYQAPTALTYEEAQRRAGGQLNPQYQEALSDRMAALSTQLRQTGMYGQAPTIPITQEAAARIEAARMGAVGAQANTLMSQASQEALQQRQLAQSQWGTETGLSLQAQGMNRDEAQRQVANILAVASAVDQQRAQEAGLTGYYGGAPTIQRTGMEAELTGTYAGSPTWARQAQQAQLSLSAQTAQAQAKQEAQSQAWLQQVQQAGLTGVYGGEATLAGRQAQAAAQQADTAAQQAAQEFAWQRTAQEAGLTGAYGGQPTLQARQYGTQAAQSQAELDWQKQYQGGSLAQQKAESDWQKQYQQGQLDIERGTATTKPSPGATQNALQGIISALQQGTTVNDVIANVLSNVPAMTAQGVDLKQIYDYLDRLNTTQPNYAPQR